ncbi:MAG: VWA domain-containing protein [Pirellulales bacterium]
MTSLRKKSPSPARNRRGAIVVLVAVLMTVLVTLSAFAVNLVYMEITRTELRITCDAAAKAAIVKLGSSQSQSTARSFARTIAATNPVAGQTLSLTDAQIEFGNSSKNGAGTYVFTANATPLNSARVTSTMNVDMVFGRFLSTTSFTPSQQSVVMRVNHDVVLVLDRSASMAFDQSNAEFDYPEDRSFGTNFQNYFQTPSPTSSRWKSLSDAVGVFVTTLQTRQLDAQVGLVTYAEDYDFGDYSCVEASLDVPFTKTYSNITNKMTEWNNKELLGDTNIEAGLRLGRATVIGTGARQTAQRTIVLLTDGVPTSGDFDTAALTQQFRTTDKIVTHVVTFGGQAATGANQTRMQNTAANGNGKYYHAPNSATLQTVFRQIAESLPAVYID